MLSPQQEADVYPPRIDLSEPIKIPVYQKRLFDFTPFIYEDGGIKNVKQFYIDYNLDIDSDGDGNKKNDNDMPNMRLLKSPTQVKVEFGPYDDIFIKKIGLHAIDGNLNHGYKEVTLQVYSPIPQITSDQNGTLR